jgi:hypothetical protein
MNSHGKRRNDMNRYFCVSALAATLVVMSGPVSAQSQASSNSMPGKIDSILAAVAPAGHVELATGSVFVRNSDLIICAAANVGTQPMMVLIRIVASDGTVNYGGGNGTPILVDPGKTIYGSNSVFPSDFRRCEFEFDGAAANIRGTLTYEGDTSPQLVLDAR